MIVLVNNDNGVLVQEILDILSLYSVATVINLNLDGTTQLMS